MSIYTGYTSETVFQKKCREEGICPQLRAERIQVSREGKLSKEETRELENWLDSVYEEEQ